MTATLDQNTTEAPSSRSTGRVARVIGPVIDVEFPVDDMPEIYNALTVDVTIGDGGDAHADARGGAAHRRRPRAVRSRCSRPTA
jgi:F-type H+-transporting ATPase subunit beta